MNDNMKVDLVVTRHPGLLDVLKELGLCDETTRVISHAYNSDVEGKHVVGVLPHSMSCLCASFTELRSEIPPEWRGKELSYEEVRQVCKGYRTYKVTTLREVLL